eukprot:gene32251-16817_t
MVAKTPLAQNQFCGLLVMFVLLFLTSCAKTPLAQTVCGLLVMFVLLFLTSWPKDPPSPAVCGLLVPDPPIAKDRVCGLPRSLFVLRFLPSCAKTPLAQTVCGCW